MKTSFIAIGLFAIMSSAFSQNGRTGRKIDQYTWQRLGMWYDSSTAMYQVQYPILPHIPPLEGNMPYSIRQIYERIDRVVRNDDDGQTEREITNGNYITPQWWIIARDLYKVVDYNPIIFKQYLDEAHLTPNTYVTLPMDLVSTVQETIRSKGRDIPESKALYSLLYCDYILRVNVIQIDSMVMKQPSQNSLNPSLSTNPYRFRVTAQVLDTLKGQVMPPCISSPSLSAALSPGAPCIQFQYTRNNYFDPISPLGYKRQDPAFTASPENGFRMLANQEAIIFLSHHGEWVDYSNDYYNLELEPQASNNALPIIDGHVRDVNLVWSDAESLSYDEWKQRFFEIRDALLLGTYRQ